MRHVKGCQAIARPQRTQAGQRAASPTLTCCNGMHAASGPRSAASLQPDMSGAISCGSASDAAWLWGQPLTSKLLSCGKRENITLSRCGSAPAAPSAHEQWICSAPWLASSSVQNHSITARADHNTLEQLNTSIRGSRASWRSSRTLIWPLSGGHVSCKDHFMVVKPCRLTGITSAFQSMQRRHSQQGHKLAGQRKPLKISPHRPGSLAATAPTIASEESKTVATCMGPRHTVVLAYVVKPNTSLLHYIEARKRNCKILRETEGSRERERDR